MSVIHGIFFNDWKTTKVTVTVVGRAGAICGQVFDQDADYFDAENLQRVVHAWGSQRTFHT